MKSTVIHKYRSGNAGVRALIFVGIIGICVEAFLIWQCSKVSTDLAQQNVISVGRVGEARRRLLELKQRRDERLQVVAKIEIGDFTPSSESNRSALLWLKQFHALLDLLMARPDADIPEMRFLSGSDWMMIARNVRLDSDEGIQRALATLRSTAKAYFVRDVASAIKKYQREHGGAFPPNLVALETYLPRPIGGGALDRYEILSADPSIKREYRSVWLIREKGAVDEQFDGRFGVDINGVPILGGRGGPRSWVEDPGGYNVMIAKAKEAFASDRPGIRANGLKDLAPYIQPPLPAKQLERLLLDEQVQKW